MVNQTEAKIDWERLSEDARNERRIGSRVTMQFPVEVSGNENEETRFRVKGRTRNVSLHGCCFEMEHNILRGDVVALKVMRRDREGRVQATDQLPFRAAWVVQEGNVWVVGAEMVTAVVPWGITFPPKGTPVKRA